MSSGADQKASAGDNIVNEQPIEISSDSSIEDNSGCDAPSDSDSDVSILSSLVDSTDSHDDQKLADEFSAILAIPNKRYKHYMDLCTTAFKLNVFEKIEVAINEFQEYTIVPPHIWLRYLKTLKVVTQTPAEWVVFQTKCSTALTSFYDDQLAEFVVKSLMEQPLVDHLSMWSKILADYGLERIDFIEEVRKLLSGVNEKDEIEKVEQTMSTNCVTWSCDKDKLEAIADLIDEFKQKLKSNAENSSWLQESYLLRAETLSLSTNLKCSLAKLIYERCLAKYPTDSRLWLDYIAYMEKPMEPEGEAMAHTAVCDGYLKCKPLELINRVLQTRPTIALNHKYLELMEQNKLSPEQVDSEIKRQLQRIEPYMEMNVELQLDYLAYRVRHTEVHNEEQVNQLRDAFREVWDRLSELYGDLADTSYEVLQLWAQVEYAKLNNPENGAAIWCEIFNYPGSSVRSHLWLSYAQMEIEYNKGHKVSIVLRQALEALSMTPDVHVIVELYRRNERCFGNYESIAECQKYCEAYVEQQQHVDPYRQQSAWRQGNNRRIQSYQKPEKKPPIKSSRKQLPAAKKIMPSEPPAKETKESNFKYSPNMEENKIFIKNLYANCTKDDLTDAFESFGTIKDVRLVYRPSNQRFKGIAYIEFEKAEDAQKAVIGGDGIEIGGQKIEVAISNPPPKLATGPSTSSGAATVAAAAGDKKKPEKRRIQTSLIPTRLVLNEVKRRKKLELDDDAAVSSTNDAANGNSNSANGNDNGNGNGNETANEPEQSSATATVPKSNDDFRKLFNI
ncbi:RNA-binding protein 4F isoform X1 [Drosophila hydei]|uniref:RNA-binding protein 4F isoform X1 n=1 Tax=Drosophila hydei TaxID=7224 RepID=A0A6J1LFL0_DROHY|nr:RNA-binding protein 4F isoform X1 [Drosophila hydei]